MKTTIAFVTLDGLRCEQTIDVAFNTVPPLILRRTIMRNAMAVDEPDNFDGVDVREYALQNLRPPYVYLELAPTKPKKPPGKGHITAYIKRLLATQTLNDKRDHQPDPRT